MKKILLYTDTPLFGGAEVQMFLLAKFLDKNKFMPILACSKSEALDKWCENFEKEGLRVIRLNVKSKHDLRHYSLLQKIIKEEKIDLLHAHIWNPGSCRYAYLAAKKMKIPMVITEHDPFKLSFLKDLFKKRVLKHVSQIITVSQNNAKVIKQLYPKHSSKIKIIHNGIDITWWHSQLIRFTEKDYKEIKENIFEAREDTLIIASVAELNERKGQKYLIKAMPDVIEKFPNVKLVLIGEGPDRKNLENLIEKFKLKNHVILIGQRKKIPPYLKASDIFVLPSIREAFGLVNLEAMTIPLPVIATRVGGIPEIIENEKNGILVAPGNEKALSKAIIDLITHPKKREKLAQNGEKLVSEKFSALKMAQEYEKIYLTVSINSPILRA